MECFYVDFLLIKAPAVLIVHFVNVSKRTILTNNSYFCKDDSVKVSVFKTRRYSNVIFFFFLVTQFVLLFISLLFLTYSKLSYQLLGCLWTAESRRSSEGH